MKNILFKRIIPFLLIVCLAFPLMGCDDDDDDSDDDGEFNPYPYEDLSVYMDLPDYKSFTIKREVVEKLVKAELMSFCQKNKLTETFSVAGEVAAKKYDYVMIDFNGKIDGQTFDGGVASDYYLLLGSEAFIDGFEDGVIGMKVGETKNLFLKFPDDYYSSKYAGKDVVFTVTLKEIERMPELNDGMCAENSIYDSKEELMRALEEHCIFDYEWQALMEKCTLKGYPTEYTEYYQAYYQYCVDYYTEAAQGYGMTLTEYLAVNGASISDIREVADNYAKSNTINDLLTYSIMKAENIALEGEEWDNAVRVFENEQGMTYAEMVKKSGKTAVTISVLTVRISEILYGYVTVVD